MYIFMCIYIYIRIYLSYVCSSKCNVLIHTLINVIPSFHTPGSAPRSKPVFWAIAIHKHYICIWYVESPCTEGKIIKLNENTIFRSCVKLPTRYLIWSWEQLAGYVFTMPFLVEEFAVAPLWGNGQWNDVDMAPESIGESFQGWLLNCDLRGYSVILLPHFQTHL